MESITTISGYDGLYSITCHGKVFSNGRLARQMKDFDNGRGYRYVSLYKDGKYKNYLVHRLVYLEFAGDIPEEMEVNHIDGDKCNNNLFNLELVTRTQNMQHASENNLLNPNKHIVQGYNPKTGVGVVIPAVRYVKNYGHDVRSVQRCIQNPKRKHHNMNWCKL